MLETLARLGYASKALIYAIVGTLAIAAAANQGGRITDTSGALRVVLSQPYGRALLLVLAIGLCGYAIWRLLDAIKDPDRHGTGFHGVVVRIGNVVRGVIYGALGLEAFRLFRGLSGSDGGETEAWAARVLDLPLGVLVLGIVGCIVTVYGASETIGSLRGKDDPLVDFSCIPANARSWVRKVMRFGVGARGLIIISVGVLVVRAALQHDASEAAGTRESMLELVGVVDGRWLLWLVAAGLLAYAVDQAVHSWCRRIRPVM